MATHNSFYLLFAKFVDTRYRQTHARGVVLPNLVPAADEDRSDIRQQIDAGDELLLPDVARDDHLIQSVNDEDNAQRLVGRTPGKCLRGEGTDLPGKRFFVTRAEQPRHFGARGAQKLLAHDDHRNVRPF